MEASTCIIEAMSDRIAGRLEFQRAADSYDTYFFGTLRTVDDEPSELGFEAGASFGDCYYTPGSLRGTLKPAPFFDDCLASDDPHARWECLSDPFAAPMTCIESKQKCEGEQP